MSDVEECYGRLSRIASNWAFAPPLQSHESSGVVPYMLIAWGICLYDRTPGLNKGYQGQIGGSGFLPAN